MLPHRPSPSSTFSPIMPSFEQEALGIIQNALNRGVPARLIHQAARMLQSYELMFWDAMADAAGVPLDRGA